MFSQGGESDGNLLERRVDRAAYRAGGRERRGGSIWQGRVPGDRIIESRTQISYLITEIS